MCSRVSLPPAQEHPLVHVDRYSGLRAPARRVAEETAGTRTPCIMSEWSSALSTSGGGASSPPSNERRTLAPKRPTHPRILAYGDCLSRSNASRCHVIQAPVKRSSGMAGLECPQGRGKTESSQTGVDAPEAQPTQNRIQVSPCLPSHPSPIMGNVAQSGV